MFYNTIKNNKKTKKDNKKTIANIFMALLAQQN